MTDYKFNRPNRLNNISFITKCKEKYMLLYDFYRVNYKDYFTPVEIICKTCLNSFFPTPSNFLSKNGSNCPFCSVKKHRLKNNTFIELAKTIHGETYDYSETNYFNAKTKVIIICTKCKSVFQQLPRSHIYCKSGCPFCKNSHGERKIRKLLKASKIEFFEQFTFDLCRSPKGKMLRFDFFIPSINTCIEFDGKQHFDKTSIYWKKEIEEYDNIKNSFCRENGIILKRIRKEELEKIKEPILTFLTESYK